MAKNNEEKKKTNELVKSASNYLTSRSDNLAKWCVKGAEINPTDLIRVGTMVVAREPKLQDPRVMPSLYLSILTAAQLGLNPSGIFGEGYIIPYWDKASGHHLAQFQPGYRGLVKLVRQSGEIRSMRSVVVYSGDEFHYQEGSEPEVYHVINTSSERGKPVGSYSIAEWRDDSWDAIWCPQNDIDRAKKDTPAWSCWPDEMAKKFAIKRHSKQLPMSPKALLAIHVDNAEAPTEFDPSTGEVIDVEVLDVKELNPASGLEKKLEARKKARKPAKSGRQAIGRAVDDRAARETKEEAKAEPPLKEESERPPIDEPDFHQCELCGEPSDRELCAPCEEGVRESEAE